MSKEMVLTPEELAENTMLNAAIGFALAKHKNGLRKGTKMPYIVHPLEVMHNLMLMGADKNLMAAGVLHDTVEDTDATLEEIAEKFGEDVASLVASHTEKDKSLPWKTRKKIALEHLKHATKREQMLVLADKLSNMRAIARDYKELGDKLWERFNRGKESQAWYYHEGASAFIALANDKNTAEFYDEFVDLVGHVFSDITVEETKKNMKFMIAEDYGLCREDEEDNHASFTYGDVWGFNGYAFGAFRGFERASHVTVEKAKEYLIKEHGLTPEVAETKLYEPSLDREATIEHIKQHTNLSYYRILEMIGFTSDAASKYT